MATGKSLSRLQCPLKLHFCDAAHSSQPRAELNLYRIPGEAQAFCGSPVGTGTMVVAHASGRVSVLSLPGGSLQAGENCSGTCINDGNALGCTIELRTSTMHRCSRIDMEPFRQPSGLDTG